MDRFKVLGAEVPENKSGWGTDPARLLTVMTQGSVWQVEAGPDALKEKREKAFSASQGLVMHITAAVLQGPCGVDVSKPKL